MMQYTAAVITVSDKGWRGEREDTSGPSLCRIVQDRGYKVEYTSMVPDEAEMIRRELLKCTDELHVSLVLTTGGTGFSPRDITPEATKDLLERETPGIPELMRAESMKITPRGCLSRSIAGIRGRSLIINLPGSEKASRENLLAVIDPVEHGLKMLLSEGSSDCADSPSKKQDQSSKKNAPNAEEWLKEARSSPDAGRCGMFLLHNGTVRQSPREQVRNGLENLPAVTGMFFSYDENKVQQAKSKALQMPGIFYVRIWLNSGVLNVGDNIMFVLVGGDIRPHVVDALQSLVEEIKTHCVTEREISE